MSKRVSQLLPIGGRLQRAASNARQEWPSRDALLLQVRDSEGRTGLGEAAPLPGYSPDSLEACQRALHELILPDKPLSLGVIADVIEALPPTLPAARFAVEGALLDLLAQERQTSISSLLGASAEAALRCALLDSKNAIASIPTLLARGISTAKLKVGRSWTDELALIRKLRSQAPDLRLRLDANGLWSVGEARARLLELATLGIELVEQPVSPAEMDQLCDSPVPLAADESMRTAESRALLAPLIADKSLVAVVLKPTVLGGMLACLELEAWAARSELASIASHCFEGPVGTACVAELALASQGRFAAGVDAHLGLTPYSDIPVPQLAGPDICGHRPGLGVRWPT